MELSATSSQLSTVFPAIVLFGDFSDFSDDAADTRPELSTCISSDDFPGSALKLLVYETSVG